MTDLCKMLGIKKLNTTAYHPECDSMVEQSTVRTLQTIASLRKHATAYGNQWDRYLYGMPQYSAWVNGRKSFNVTLRCSYGSVYTPLVSCICACVNVKWSLIREWYVTVIKSADSVAMKSDILTSIQDHFIYSYIRNYSICYITSYIWLYM